MRVSSVLVVLLALSLLTSSSAQTKRGITFEVFNDKRAISKAQAKKFGEFFSISPAVFI